MSKQDKIREFVESNYSTTWTTSELCEAVGCSLPTLLKFIKENPNFFEKRGRGSYRILSQDVVLAAGSTSAASVSTSVATSYNSEEVSTLTNSPIGDVIKPTFDW